MSRLIIELSDEQVAEIRSRYQPRVITQKQLAVKYGISQGHVARIVSGQARNGFRARPPQAEPSAAELATECWMIVAEPYSAYEVSTLGRVRRRVGGIGARAGKVLRPRVRKDGYVMVALWANGRRRDILLHHLVLETFVSPRPPGKEGCHKNSRPADCRISNLRWDTRDNNIADRNNARLAESCGLGHTRKWIPNGRNPNGKERRTLVCLDCRRAKARDRYRNNNKRVR